MIIPNQMSGTLIDARGEIHEAMFCIDDDLPNEGMLHWWKREEGKYKYPPQAMLLTITKKGKKLFLLPKRYYVVDEIGGLCLKTLNDDELAILKGYSCTLFESDSMFSGDWEHKSGQKGILSLRKLISDSSDFKIDQCNDWLDFKTWSDQIIRENAFQAFRGHGSNKFKLKTTFHRVGRYRLERYCSEELSVFHRHAEMALSVRLNRNDREDYATLLGLAQHHGLPTPMLDWSASPYIAAFFAFSDALESMATRKKETHIRVYALSKDYSDRISPAVVSLPYFSPYISFLEIFPRFNPRLYAQQGKFLVTNVSDLEGFLCERQKAEGLELFKAADVPITCLKEAMNEFKHMGLTSATMFPGLDGACKMMRQQMLLDRL